MLDAVEIDSMTIEPLLFQTGYLTVKEIDCISIPPVYLCGMPNDEVRVAFNLHILAAMTENDEVRTDRARINMGRALRACDLQAILDTLRGLFASIPHNLHIDLEAYYHSLFYTVMNVLGFDMAVEVSVSGGRVDAVIELSDQVYIMEFKYTRCPPDADAEKKRQLFEKTLDEAMGQIKEKGYSKKYVGSGKKVYEAAFAFLGRDNIEMRVG